MDGHNFLCPCPCQALGRTFRLFDRAYCPNENHIAHVMNQDFDGFDIGPDGDGEGTDGDDDVSFFETNWLIVFVPAVTVALMCISWGCFKLKLFDSDEEKNKSKKKTRKVAAKDDTQVDKKSYGAVSKAEP